MTRRRSSIVIQAPVQRPSPERESIGVVDVLFIIIVGLVTAVGVTWFALRS